MHQHGLGIRQLDLSAAMGIRRMETRKLIEPMDTLDAQGAQYPLIKEYTLNHRGLYYYVLKYIP